MDRVGLQKSPKHMGSDEGPYLAEGDLVGEGPGGVVGECHACPLEHVLLGTRLLLGVDLGRAGFGSRSIGSRSRPRGRHGGLHLCSLLPLGFGLGLQEAGMQSSPILPCLVCARRQPCALLSTYGTGTVCFFQEGDELCPPPPLTE